MRWVALVCGALIIVSVFLPWASMNVGFGMSATEAGFERGWGILSLIMGFISVGLAFLPIPKHAYTKIRGGGHTAAGALAIIGVAGYWSALGSELGPFMEAVSPGPGLYLCLVAAVAVIVAGIVELRQKVGIGELHEEVAPSGVPKAEVEQPVATPRKEIEPSPEISEPVAFAEERPTVTGEAVGIIGDRNRLIAVAIGLVILAILSGVAFRLPEASTHITGGLFVGDVIKLVIAVIMLVIIMAARLRLAIVITYYARRGFKVEQYPARAAVVGNIDGLSTELANIVIIAIVWPIVVQIVKLLLLLDVGGDLGWITILVTLAFVALLLYRLYRGYQLLGPVLGVIGKVPQKISCPKCGTLNRASTKFCSSCGAEFEPRPAEKVKPTSLHCSKCGAENSPDAKFCANCGCSLSATEEKDK